MAFTSSSIAIRVDASIQIGSGHVFRCLSLAEALRATGADVRFVCRAWPGNLNQLIADRGFVVHALPAPGSEADHWAWTRENWRQDDAELRSLSLPCNLLAVDHYALDAAWESAARAGFARLLVIDDLANRPHECDALLDQNLYRNAEIRYKGRVASGTKLLLGPRYALLSASYSQERALAQTRTGEVQRVLIFFGGTDPSDMTSHAVAALAEDLNQRHIHADVVVGAANPNISSVQAVCGKLEKHSLHIQTNRMPELIRQADLAIGAGGTVTWERCCLGLPALVVSIADNQVELSQFADESGLLAYLGDAAQITPDRLRQAFRTLVENPAALRKMSDAGMALVDGQGAARVAHEVLFLQEGVP